MFVFLLMLPLLRRPLVLNTLQPLSYHRDRRREEELQRRREEKRRREDEVKGRPKGVWKGSEEPEDMMCKTLGFTMVLPWCYPCVCW